MSERRVEHPVNMGIKAQQSELSAVSVGSFNISRNDDVLIPPKWKAMLPDNKVATVLPFEQASVFRDLCRESSLVLRPDGNADILGLLRGEGLKSVAITGVFDRSGKQASGFLTFSGSSSETKEIPEIAFTILYGHPDNSWMDWDGFFNTLEEGFAKVDRDSVKRKRMIGSWEPHLAPLSEVMNSLEESAFAVIFSGKDHDMGRLKDLGVRKFPVITPTYRYLMNKLWQSVPRMVGRGGGFIPIGV